MYLYVYTFIRFTLHLQHLKQFLPLNVVLLFYYNYFKLYQNIFFLNPKIYLKLNNTRRSVYAVNIFLLYEITITNPNTRL